MCRKKTVSQRKSCFCEADEAITTKKVHLNANFNRRPEVTYSTSQKFGPKSVSQPLTGTLALTPLYRSTLTKHSYTREKRLGFSARVTYWCIISCQTKQLIPLKRSEERTKNPAHVIHRIKIKEEKNSLEICSELNCYSWNVHKFSSLHIRNDVFKKSWDVWKHVCHNKQVHIFVIMN